MKKFPPDQISDLDKYSASKLVALKRLLVSGSTVSLMLGAGTSASAGVPTWDALLRRIVNTYFMHWKLTKDSAIKPPPTNISIALVGEFFEHMHGDALPEDSSPLRTQDPLLVAQQIKNCIRDIDWRYLLNKILYPEDRFVKGKKVSSQLLSKLAYLCKAYPNISRVINYNFDSFFSEHLIDIGLRPQILWKGKPEKQTKSGISIFHPHGYLPFGGGPCSEIILAENEYHAEYLSPYSWGNLAQSRAMLDGICIFVGLSMSDPNLRRILRASREITEAIHYCFLFTESKDAKPIDEEMLFDYDMRRLGVRVIRIPYKKDDQKYDRLHELIEYIAS